MESRSISFYSEGVRLAGDLFLPGDLKHGEARAGIVLCHGYTGVRNLYLPDIARVLTEAGYVVLTFDYKGWGDSEGPKSRLAPYSRVTDVQAALTLLGAQHEVDPERLGIYGTSYGGATVVWVAAVDPRVKCVVSRGRHRQRPALDAQRAPARRVSRPARAIRRGPRPARDWRAHSEFVERNEILLPDRQSAELAAAARRGNPGAVERDPAGVRRRYARASTRNGWSTGSRRGRCCSSPPTTTGWCRRRKARRCTRAPASRRSWSCCRASATTRSMPARRSAR